MFVFVVMAEVGKMLYIVVVDDDDDGQKREERSHLGVHVLFCRVL